MKRKTLTKRRSSYSSSQLRPISISTSPPPHFASKITIFNNKNVAEKTVAKGSQLIDSGERAPGGPIYRYIYLRFQFSGPRADWQKGLKRGV